jgi:hypothetical protein
MFDRSNSPYLEVFNQQIQKTWPNLGANDAKFLEFLEPVKSYCQNNANLLAFSISKYLEIPDSIAFWLEILAQTCFLHEHLYLLDNSNLEILKQEYTKLPNIAKTQFHLGRSYSLQQIQWLQTWVWQTHIKVLSEFPHLKNSLNQSFWQKHLLSRVSFVTSFFEDKIIMGDLLQSLGNGFGLFEIKIPVLVGFSLALEHYPKYTHSESNWHLLENFLHQISTVYSILHLKDQVLPEFLYYHKLTETQKESWWLKSELDRKNISAEDEEVRLAIKNIIAQYDQNLSNDINNLDLPKEFLDFLVELSLWVFKPARSE